ncbi:cytochrome b5-like heme/steroid binding domain-containing protein [Globomyces pollinis-pini]|nr:cytochrome b5-like heme/steroid binding domain-containing protein [Globomyces pollinis-pini]KAI8897537.1 cytochrome b5-like heme/steroid binding domain-containing protein [Globomyces pollinis-pini]KAJ3000679.1 hypothetical protein HDV02_004364 [Globomyces sp. JEL0801]
MANFTVEQVSAHTSDSDCWIIIDGKVYDVSSFLNDHPGGKKVLMKVAGKDATTQFNNFHNAASVIKKYGPQFYKGDLISSKL